MGAGTAYGKCATLSRIAGEKRWKRKCLLLSFNENLGMGMGMGKPAEGVCLDFMLILITGTCHNWPNASVVVVVGGGGGECV